ncbi:hypothetical protein RHGRI_012174 [Rhododendron griersonianum]|uniref:Uncharacterized protein n=1 Tax=Rhododendron griersonianum TaxID=479676 RepID=A0AAV6KQR7_9ERIC|nr:hypothetical protein RHGRI_012174 [Rhododendron griersonianum]
MRLRRTKRKITKKKLLAEFGVKAQKLQRRNNKHIALAEITMDPSLYTAAMEGKPEDLKHYTNRFALQFTKNNNTVLHVIAAFGHSHCVKEILDACPHLLRRENTHGDTPLHMAAAGGHDDVVEWLIDSAKELNKTASANDAVRGVSGGEGSEPFKTAAADDGISGGGEGNEPNITAAANDGVGGSVVSGGGCEGGVSPDSVVSGGGSEGGVSPDSVVSGGSSEGGVSPDSFLSVLFGGGSEGGVSLAVREMLKARNRDGDTPLHLAARFRHPLPVVSLLTNADRELYYGPNKAGETPLYLVVDRGSDAAAVSEILKNCKSPAFRGPDGRTAMHAAAIDSSKDAILNELLKWKQDLIKEQDTKGWTPLHLAAHNGNLEAVKKLLDKDISVAYITANNDEGNTALHVATIRGDVSVMDELLSKVPDCWEMENSKGQNILHIAADRERDAATNFIREKPWVNCLINRKDNEGNTPVHVLASKGKDGLQMCPEADMRVLNNEPLTPLDILHRKVVYHCIPFFIYFLELKSIFLQRSRDKSGVH